MQPKKGQTKNQQTCVEKQKRPPRANGRENSVTWTVVSIRENSVQSRNSSWWRKCFGSVRATSLRSTTTITVASYFYFLFVPVSCSFLVFLSSKQFAHRVFFLSCSVALRLCTGFYRVFFTFTGFLAVSVFLISNKNLVNRPKAQ